MIAGGSPLSERNMKNSLYRKTLLFYTALFAVFAAFVFGLFFLRYDRSLIRTPDGLSQHAVIFAYYGEYLRTILRNIFIEHTFVIPMFDFSVGMGNDIVSTLNYYGVGDPLNLLSAFVPVKYSEYMYCFVAVLRMYLSGLTFAVYMLHRKSDKIAVVMGAFAYAFSGFCMRAVTWHPFFLTGMLYIPFIFLGIDYILEKKSPVLYIAALALITVTNFYFAYMACIMMVIYAALRYFTVYRKSGAKVFFATVAKFAVFTINGFLLPMIIFMTQITGVLATDRLNVKNLVTALYTPSYYRSLLDGITNPSSGSHWIAIGYTGITLLCIFVCFIRAKKNAGIVAGFSLSVAATLFPVFGHIFNGFSYVVNRWIWIMAFIGSAALTMVFDTLFELTAREKKKLLVISLAYVAFVFIAAKGASNTTMLMLAVMLAGAGIAFVAGTEILTVKAAKRVMCILLICAVFMQFSNRYDINNNELKTHIRLGDFYSTSYDSTVAALVNRVDDGSEFFRYDDNNCAVNENAALNADVNSTAFYYSIANSNVSEFIKELGLNVPFEQRILNLDYRTLLQSLTGCRYVSGEVGFSKMLLYSGVDEKTVLQNSVTVNDSGNAVAYFKGFASHSSSPESVLKLNEFKYALPMGYTYDSVMSRDEYEKLNPAEKQNVLLQTAVTDGVSSIPSADVRTEGLLQADIFELIRNGAVISEGIEISGNSIRVTDPSATITLNVNVPAYSEYYMLAGGIDYENISPFIGLREELTEAVEAQQEYYDAEAQKNGTESSKIAEVDPLGIKYLENAEKEYSGLSQVEITVASKLLNSMKDVKYSTPKYQYYTGFDTFMANLGCTMFADESESGFSEDTVVIAFSNEGVYNIEEWKLCWQSLDYVKADYKARTADVLENVEITNCENTVKGTISLAEPKLLATQIPYSEGWTVTVDGKEAELLNVNTMFCGVMLDEGEHTIEFNYVTPNAGLSLLLTAAGIAQLVATAVIFRIIRKKREAAAFVSEAE